MKRINLNVGELTAETITNLYLFGRKTTPSFEELRDNPSILDREDIEIYIGDMDSYMKTFGRFANASRIEVVQKFFGDFGKDLEKGKRYEFSIDDIGGKRVYNFKQVDFKGENEKEWAERAYIFNSQNYFLTKNAKFIIDENGNKYIENFALMPGKEDFDFDGGDWMTNIGNSYLEGDIDPYRFGKSIEITYPDSSNNEKGSDYNKYGLGKKYNLEDYNKDIIRYNKEDHGTYWGLEKPMKELVESLWNAGVIKYTDGEGRTIIYGSNRHDQLSIAKLLGKIKDYYSWNQDKGVAFVGWKNNDILTGTPQGDILYGGEGSDTLNGGNGYDIYHADENDTINDSDGSGKVYLGETKLKGGRFIKEQSHGNIEIYKSNDDSITYEYNTSTKVLNANGLKINDFDNNELEINLQKEQSNEFAILSDTTGSMGGAISSVKSQAKEIIKTAFARDTNTKVGVFGYNDPGVQTFTNLTNDQNAIMSAINSLYADGGGDTPEMTWHGIYNAANSNWSEYSVKRIFVFGDAPAKDNEFKSKAMAALLPNKPRAAARSLSAANALYGNNHSDLNNIQVFTIQTGGGEDVAAEFKELAESTGGGYVNMTNSGYTSVADALFDAMNTGTSKNETIVGNEKNNIINGKGGDDVLEGREGSDTYVFEENFGKDTIIETNKENKDKNIIDMSAFSLKDVVFRQNKNDVVVNRSKFDAVTIRDFYSEEEKISQIKFKDVTLGYEEIKDITALQSNKEVIKFANKGENKLKALLKKVFFKADDETATTIKGGVRSDALVGSNLNDKIYGNLGHDTLIGGKGDDYLDGGLGNDKYVFRKGDGKDVISDCGGNDTLILKNINKNELELFKEKNDLILKFKEGSDQITIKDHFKRSLGYNHRLENIKFADGTQMSYKQIEDIVRAGEYTGGLKQASSLKNDYFVPQDTVNKIIEQLNSYADNSQALEFMSNNAQKDNIQIYMS